MKLTSVQTWAMTAPIDEVSDLATRVGLVLATRRAQQQENSAGVPKVRRRRMAGKKGLPDTDASVAQKVRTKNAPQQGLPMSAV